MKDALNQDFKFLSICISKGKRDKQKRDINAVGLHQRHKHHRLNLIKTEFRQQQN